MKRAVQSLLRSEQLLSDVASAPSTPSTNAQRPPARPAIVGSAPNVAAPNYETRRPEPAQIGAMAERRSLRSIHSIHKRAKAAGETGDRWKRSERCRAEL